MRARRLFLITLLLCLGTATARADINTIQPLSFGKWVIANNRAVRSIIVSPSGTYSASSGVIMIAPPQQGIYQIGDLPANSVINNVTVIETSPLRGGGPRSFTTDDYQVAFPPATDATGHATVTIGATAHTSGDGGGYNDAIYTGTLELTFDLAL